MARHHGAFRAGARCLAEWRTDKLPLLCDNSGGAVDLSAAASFQRQVALWVTSCIVNNPPKAVSSKEASVMMLLCPGNESLSGVSASYFPRGWRKGDNVVANKEPAWMASSSWCGMEAGINMVYPAQCVDGLVDRAGGASLRSDLRRVAMRELRLRRDVNSDKAVLEEGVLCPVGHAVASAPPTGSSLRQSFSVIIHTATPTWPGGCPSGAAQWRKDALSCYSSSLRAGSTAVAKGEQIISSGGVVVSPLICAGTRGAPQEEAAKVAAEAAAEWLTGAAALGREAAEVDGGSIRGLWFAVQSEETAAEVLRCFKESPLGNPCREACDAGGEGIDLDAV